MRVTPPRDRRRLVGAALLAAVALLALLLWQRPDPFARHLVVRAIVRDAAGLARIGADVRVAGTPVGRVDGVRRTRGGAELTLQLDPSVGTVHRDATAALRPRLMFEGTAYVALTLGSPGAPPLGARPIRRMSTYVPVGDALRILDARGRANLRATASGLARSLAGSTPQDANAGLREAPALVRDAGAVAAAVHGDDLRAAVAGLSATAAAVASRAGDLLPAADAARTTADAVPAGALDATLARLPATTAEVRAGGAAAADTLARLDSLVRDLEPAARRLAPARAAARPLLRAAAPALRQATPVLGDTATLLRAAPGAAGAAQPALEALRQPLARLNGGLLDALERRTTLGTPAYLAFLGLFAGGGGASRPFGAQGDGHFMRFGLRFLTGAGQPLPPCTLLDRANAALGAAVAQAGGCTP